MFPQSSVAHARVSASRLGLSIADYLMRLPMERVRQIHVSGPRQRDGVMVDAHEPLLEEDCSLLRDLLEVTAPLAVTLEYDCNEAALKEQLGELRDILKRQR